MSGWLESLGSAVGVDAAAALEQLKQQAEKLKEDATPALGAAFDAVRTQAVKIKEEAVHAAHALQQAAEQANNEILAEQERVKSQSDPHRWADHIIALLPWEAEEEGHSILVQPLMEQILALGLDERNFAPLSEAERAQFPFKLENHVDVITRLLPLDPNLGKMHARLGSRMAEDEFWRAYFYRCACLRAAVGMTMAGGKDGGGGGGGSVNYPLIGEPLSVPTPLAPPPPPEQEKGEKGEEEEGGKAATSSLAAGSTAAGADASSKPSSSSSSSPPAAQTAGGAAGEKEEEGEGEDDDLDGSLDLDGLDLGSDDGGEGGGELLEGDALKELEAQIAAELDAEGL